MLFSIKNTKLEEIKEHKFKLEKEIQTLIDNNIEKLFNLELLASEIKVGNFRFDTVSFNRETSSFYIIEYKKSSNESVIDQGYAYLQTLLDRKAEFVLLYNKKFNKSLGLNDFDWTQCRIIFVSTYYNSYQLATANPNKLPFEMYLVKKFENKTIELQLLNNNLNIDLDSLNRSNPNISKNVNKEVVVYSEDYHLSKTSDEVKEIYNDLKTKILELGYTRIESKKIYIAFKNKTNFCDFIINKNYITLSINLKINNLKDPFKMAREVNKVGHNGNGDYEVRIDKETDINNLMFLIKQSYEKNS
jgi:predicted transport protein